MKAPKDLDPDMLVVIEIIQHASEIVSRMPLAAVRAHLAACPPGDPTAPWCAATLRMVESAQLLELDGGKLSALEARTEIEPEPAAAAGNIPDDWTAR